MDPASTIDALIKKGLADTADGWFLGLVWSTVILFLGVLLEELPLTERFETYRIDLQTGRLAKRREAVFLKHAHKWLALAMVIGGIAGEGITEYLAARYEGLLRDFNEILLTATQLEAVDAKSSADSAADASRRASESAEDAIQKTKVVKAEVGALEKRATSLKKELESVQHGLTLRLDRESVLVAKRETFENALKGFAGQKVDVRYAANLQNPNQPFDPETFWFAFELQFCFIRAHWVCPTALRDVPAEHGTGVFILVGPKSSKATRDAAEALAKVLVAVPIEVRPAMRDRGLSPGSVVSVAPLPPRLPQPETAILSPLDDETIVIEVAPHP